MVWDSGKGHPIKALADGSRPKEAAQWLGTQIEGLNPEGIESNRWRERRNGVLLRLRTGRRSEMLSPLLSGRISPWFPRDLLCTLQFCSMTRLQGFVSPSNRGDRSCSGYRLWRCSK